MAAIIFLGAKDYIIRKAIFNSINCKLTCLSIQVIKPCHGIDPEITLFIPVHIIDAVIAQAVFTFFMNITGKCLCLLIKYSQTSAISTQQEITIFILGNGVNLFDHAACSTIIISNE